MTARASRLRQQIGYCGDDGALLVQLAWLVEGRHLAEAIVASAAAGIHLGAARKHKPIAYLRRCIEESLGGGRDGDVAGGRRKLRDLLVLVPRGLATPAPSRPAAAPAAARALAASLGVPADVRPADEAEAERQRQDHARWLAREARR